MIHIKNLNINYGKKMVLEGVTFSIQKGEKIAIVGKNGSGKTSLLNAILKLQNYTNGEIAYNLPEEKFYNNFGVQLQDASFDERLSVKDYCTLMESFYNKKNVITKYLNKFSLENIWKKKISSLSGGERQKLNIIFSLFHDPEVLIFDEITTGLDSISRKMIRKYISEISSDKTMIIVSHYMKEIEELCDRVVLIKDSKIILDDSIDNIVDKYSTVENMYINLIGE